MSAQGDALRRLADLADAGVLGGRDYNLNVHHDSEEEVRTLAAILGASTVNEYESHTGTVQVSFRAKVGVAEVSVMHRTERPWAEVPS